MAQTGEQVGADIVALKPGLGILDGAAALKAVPPIARAAHDLTHTPFAELRDCQQISVSYDDQLNLLWCRMRPVGRPCFTPGLLEDARRIQHLVERLFTFQMKSRQNPLDYMVLGSAIPGIFNLGGDLRLLIEHVENGDRDALLRYARGCIDVCHANAVHGDLPFLTISLVQGDALGGGFEAALSGNVVIAERSASFGLPEILFNLFPGMGAYTFLSRRIGAAKAERLILSGTIHSAAELYELGVIDVLADDGKGEEALIDYIERHGRQLNAHNGVIQMRGRCDNLDRLAMMDVGRIWVDTALRLEKSDLRRMERLVSAQERRLAQALAKSQPVA